MNPRLVVIEGPLKGNVFPLDKKETVIGRDSSAQLSVQDSSLSRRHCKISKEGINFKVADLESLNGTFVDRIPIKEKLLQHGNEIEIGHSIFLFLTEEDDKHEPVAVLDDSFPSPDRSTVQLRQEDVVYLKPDQTQARPRAARDLGVLLRISSVIHSIHKPSDLQKKVLEMVFDSVPATFGAFLTLNKDATDFTSVLTHDRSNDTTRRITISRTVVSEVVKTEAAILSNDLSLNQKLGEASSLADRKIQSILCVPLPGKSAEKVLIYLESSDPSAPFDEHHLQLVTAVAAIAAAAMENAHQIEKLESENIRLHEEADPDHRIVGGSSAMKEVYDFIKRAAPVDSTVLIEGESGTGKELIARAIHLSSPRAMNPFIAVNCAALTDTLLESELFGHEKGAFTGAIAQKKGKFELADGGTLFLDEVGEIALSLQSKLLRALQEREIERVGGTRVVAVDVRVIAATNKNLKEEAGKGAFRQDLYYRLNVLNIQAPPLRKRKEDIQLLAKYFLSQYSARFKKKVENLSQEAKAYLEAYEWPGNVRELQNAIERAVVMTTTNSITPEDLPESLLEKDPPKGVEVGKYHEAVLDLKKDLILKAFHEANGNYTEAAKKLGVHPNYLHRLIRNLNLKKLLTEK
jgi:two-component system, NtrC family, response regulator HydG